MLSISLQILAATGFASETSPKKDKYLVDDSAQYLSFEAVLDGKCYNLSEGGRLMLMHNTHPDRDIKFRLIRFFADKRQQGRAVGIASAGEKPVKLGCTEVDGRPQRWDVERTHYVEK